MSISRKINIKHIWTSQELDQLHEITLQYKNMMNETFEMIKYSKDLIMFQYAKGDTEEDKLIFRTKSLFNMASVYLYALFEGFTRNFFKRVAYLQNGITEVHFDRVYFKFNVILRNILNEKYKINLNKQFHQWSIIKDLQFARNEVVHYGRNIRQDFKIIKSCYKAILGYFVFIESKIFKSLQSLVHT